MQHEDDDFPVRKRLHEIASSLLARPEARRGPYLIPDKVLYKLLRDTQDD